MEALDEPANVPAKGNPEPEVENWLRDSKTLKPVHRVCLTLRYLHGLTVKEIALQTGLSEMQIKGHLQYGRLLLKKELLGESE
jgi:RNA polymerase sigma-70 factor (ECF subfamily)